MTSRKGGNNFLFQKNLGEKNNVISNFFGAMRFQQKWFHLQSAETHCFYPLAHMISDSDSIRPNNILCEL